jgi:hypothetical protein
MPDDATSVRHSIGGNNPEPLDDIQSPIFSVPRTRKYLGDMSLTTLYEKMAQGEVVVVKLGGRTFITRASCDAYIARNTSVGVGDKVAIARAKKAAADSVRSRALRAAAKSRQQRAVAKKKQLTPGRQRRRREQRATEAPKAPAKAVNRPTTDSP